MVTPLYISTYCNLKQAKDHLGLLKVGLIFVFTKYEEQEIMFIHMSLSIYVCISHLLQQLKANFMIFFNFKFYFYLILCFIIFTHSNVVQICMTFFTFVFSATQM